MKLLRRLILLFLLGWSGRTPLPADPAHDRAGLNPNLAPIADGTPNGFNYLQRGAWPVAFPAHGQLYRVTVPDGFVSDGTSIPRALWSIAGIERDGLERRASWLHDYLYKNHGSVPGLTIFVGGQWRGVTFTFSREEVDGIFAVLLLDCGVTEIRAGIMWTMVRKYGESAWQSHTPKP